MPQLKKDTKGLVAFFLVVTALCVAVSLFTPLWRWIWVGPAALALFAYIYDRTISK